MKKTIEGKRYDTETAKQIGYMRSDVGKNSFSFWEETLYQKKTGEYFLHGFGHAATRYRKQIGESCWTCGEKIVPLTEKQAEDWIKKADDEGWLALI